jgi:hypothetical protein
LRIAFFNRCDQPYASVWNQEHAMNIPFLLAALATAATFGLHVVGGGPEFLDRYLASPIDLPLRSMAVILWHAASMSFALQAAALLWMAWHPVRPLGLFLAAGNLGWAALFLIVGATMLGSVWIFGQWMIFLVLAGLSLWGTARPAPAVTSSVPLPRQ